MNTKNLVNENSYYWENMYIDKREFIYKRDIWEKRNRNHNKKVVNKYFETNNTREWYQINLITLSDYLSRGKKILLNCVDQFSKFATSLLIKDKTVEVVLKGVKSIIFIIRKSDIVQRNNLTEFYNKLMN